MGFHVSAKRMLVSSAQYGLIRLAGFVKKFGLIIQDLKISL